MPGTSSFDPPPIPLARPAADTIVMRWTTDGEGEFELVPNIVCTRIKRERGAKPGLAEFRYIFDLPGGRHNVDGEWPTLPEEVMGPNATPGPYVVMPDDRLVVYLVTGGSGQGTPRLKVLFDGFVQPMAALFTHNQGTVGFTALGAPIRCWDDPLWESVYRDADKYDDPEANKRVNLESRFNPDGKPNATEDGHDVETEAGDHPAFLDVLTCDYEGIGRHWTVAMAAKYVLAVGNPEQLYVKNPNFGVVAFALDSWVPKGAWFDPEDPDSYESQPIKVPDFDVTGMPWPVALEKLLEPHGFTFEFKLKQSSTAEPEETPEPEWELEIVRFDSADPAKRKTLKMQPHGEQLDPARTNVSELNLTRDPSNVANQITVETARTRHEVCLVLAPGYQPAAADAADSNAMKLFLRGQGTAPQTATNADKYRLYVYDETGAGHWDFGTSTWVTDATPLNTVLGGEDGDESWYVRRRRPARNTLLTVDASGVPRKALLEISPDYAGPSPGPWDGSGTWFPVHGGWRLYEGGFGIVVEVNNPESWDSGNPSISFGVNAKSSGGIIRGISAQAKAGETRFHLKLTACIDSDLGLDVTAEKRDASATGYTINRYIEARDRYRVDLVSHTSPFNGGAQDVVVRDDTDAALYEASQRRTALECATMSGPVVIPRISVAYNVGDRISKIEGRDIDLRTNLGEESGEAPRYPTVVALEWTFEQRQATILHCSDQRGEGRF